MFGRCSGVIIVIYTINFLLCGKGKLIFQDDLELSKRMFIFAYMKNVSNNISKKLHVSEVCINTHTHTHTHTI